MAKRRRPPTEQEQKQINYIKLIRQWKNLKLMYDRFTLPNDIRPCNYLQISDAGRYACIKGNRYGEKTCEFRKYDSPAFASKEDEFYSSMPTCHKPYSLDDSPIREKTINDIEELEKLVSEMHKQAHVVKEKFFHPPN